MTNDNNNMKLVANVFLPEVMGHLRDFQGNPFGELVY